MYELASQSGLHYIRLPHPFREDNGGNATGGSGQEGGRERQRQGKCEIWKKVADEVRHSPKCGGDKRAVSG